MEECQHTRRATKERKITGRRRKMKKRISRDVIRDGNDGTIFVTYEVPSYSVLSLPGSRVRGVRCTTFRNYLVWEEERMTTVSKEVTDEIECCSPSSSVSHAPRPDGLAARGGNRPRHTCTSHSLPARSTLGAGLWTEQGMKDGEKAKGDEGWGRVQSCRLSCPSGASSVKNGLRTLLFIAFPTGGLLSVSAAADTPKTSEDELLADGMWVYIFFPRG